MPLTPGAMPLMPDDDLWLGYYVLGDDGNPRPERDVLAWAEWLETAERHVGLTRFAWGEVSTVFLGLDHSFAPDPMADPLAYRPLLWETMVFGGKLDQEQRRYRSREEAIEGHRELVERCKTGEEDPDDRIAMEVFDERTKE